MKQQTLESGLLMLLSGGALALHFASWVYGIENTSNPHALFFSSVTPIIIAGGMWALGVPISNGAQSALEKPPGCTPTCIAAICEHAPSLGDGQEPQTAWRLLT